MTLDYLSIWMELTTLGSWPGSKTNAGEIPGNMEVIVIQQSLTDTEGVVTSSPSYFPVPSLC